MPGLDLEVVRALLAVAGHYHVTIRSGEVLIAFQSPTIAEPIVVVGEAVGGNIVWTFLSPEQ